MGAKPNVWFCALSNWRDGLWSESELRLRSSLAWKADGPLSTQPSRSGATVLLPKAVIGRPPLEVGSGW
jgi:hypothetical protein